MADQQQTSTQPRLVKHIQDSPCPVCKKRTLIMEPVGPYTPGSAAPVDIRVTCTARPCPWSHTLRNMVTMTDIADGIEQQSKVIARNSTLPERPSEETYSLACQVKELLDGYELLHVMPPSPDLDYNVLRTGLDKQRAALRLTVDELLVKAMGKQILQPKPTKRPTAAQLRSKAAERYTASQQ